MKSNDSTQIPLDFMFLVLKASNDKPLLVKPADIKYITPAVVSGYNIHLKDKSYHKVNHTHEELMELLGQASYKFIGEPVPNGKTTKRCKANAKEKAGTRKSNGKSRTKATNS